MVTLTLADKTLDREALNDMMLDYYTLQIGRAIPEVAEVLTPQMATQDFWDGFDDYFAPNGALILGHDADGTLIAMAMMRKIRPDAAEFKRMYVRPAGRGHGIGLRTIEMRLEIARNLGVRTILADTLRASTTMHRIYRKLGFREIPRYPESHSAVHFPAAAKDLIYFQYDL